MEEIMKKNALFCSLTLTTALLVTSLYTRHGSNIMIGAGLGTAFGALMGGSDGIVPGLITGMAVGTTAEIIDNAQDHHHYHKVAYKQGFHQSRYRLAKELEELDFAYQKLSHYCKRIEQEIALKDQEIARMRKKVKNLERDLMDNHRTGFCITAQTFL